MAKVERRRAIAALVTIALAAAVLVVPLVALAIAQASPKIAFLNPSDYSGGASEAPLVVSDRTTGSDEEDSENETTYRLSAYTDNQSEDAVVEFEIDFFDDLGNLLSDNLGPATRVAPDAFEHHFNSSAYPDGSYTIRAVLYSGSGVTATEVARAEQDVIINNTNTSAAADIVYPANGAQTGFYVNPKNGSTNTLMTIEYSAGTGNVRIYYTTSEPGTPPEWKSCASTNFVGGDTQTASGGQTRMRCVLESIDQGGASVTGLGVVANNSQRRSYNQNLNQAGDAIRVLPYKQDAVSVSVDAPTVRADGEFGDEEICSPTQVVTVLDQLENVIGGISVDVHAQGPSDQLKFNSGGFFGGPDYSNDAPDDAHSGEENGYDCGEFFPENGFPGRQGDHNVPLGPDIKHVEGSTANFGDWGWNLYSPVSGTTQVTAWVDEDDDDLYCDDEPSVFASVGWNEPAPAPAGQQPTVFDCPIPDPPPPTDETSTSPSTTDGGGGNDGDCDIQGDDGDNELRGTEGNDVICAGGGDDDIQGLGGNDIIRAGPGNDIVQAGEGDDTVDGGSGNDRIDGGFGNDILAGLTGSDILVGAGGSDVLRGNKSVDGLQGGKGRDILQTGSGSDVADGQAGRDSIRGHHGEDILRGGGGNDAIRGAKHNDQLTGGGGNDNLDGGKGRDQCTGGRGDDKVRRCER